MEESGLLIDQLQLDAMYAYMNGLKSDKDKQTLLANYRYRYATIWSELEQKENSKLYAEIGSKQRRFNDEEADDVCDLVDMVTFSSSEIMTKKKNLKFCEEQSEIVHSFCQVNDESHDTITDDTTTNKRSQKHNNILRQNDPTHIQTTAAKLKSTQLPTTDNTPEAKPLMNKPGEFHSFQTNGKEYIKERNLSTGQQHVVNKVFEYFKKIDKKRKNRLHFSRTQ